MSATIIPRLYLHNELVPVLRDMIIEGDLKPGDKIHEGSLCERFGVSRTPLREALKVLAAEGLLQITPNRGAVVAKITDEEIDQLFPIMGALEALAGELAARQITKAGFRRLNDLHKRMVRHYEAGEWAPYIKLNREIHDGLFEVANNKALNNLYHSLMVRIHAVRYVARKSPARWAEAIDDHNRLMVALEARDGEAVSVILREHLRHKAEMVHEAMQSAVPSESEVV